MESANLEELQNELQKSIAQQEKIVDLIKQVLEIPRDDFEEFLEANKIDASKLHGRLGDMYKRFSLERRLPTRNFDDVEYMMQEYLIANDLMYHTGRGYVPTENGKKYLGLKQWASGGKGTWLNYYVFEFEELIEKVFPDILPR